MSNISAFPINTNGHIEPSAGMTLRDYFAAAALTGILAREGWPSDLASRSAYLVADAMMEARSALGKEDDNRNS